MAAPTPLDVARFLGPNYSGVDLGILTDDALQVASPEFHVQAQTILTNVTVAARAYTRTAGFRNGVPNSEISAVILSATARLISHSRQVQVTETQGPESASFGAAPFTWSVAELFVLDRYRVRAK